MHNPIFDIASEIRRNASHSNVYLVGIDGLGGSGKSILADKIRQQLEAAHLTVVTVRNDDFYLPSASRDQLPAHLKPVGGDFDWMRLRDQVLVPLKSSQLAKYARYDWPSDRLAEEHEIQPRGIVLVEGVYSTREVLRDLFDFRIWVNCPRELRLRRGLARDGHAARSRWVDDWMPAEDRYYDEQRPHTFAHAVVNGAAAHLVKQDSAND
jgi:uridine kinase